MNIVVKGKQLDVGDSLRGHVVERLGEGIRKYFSHAIEAQVVFAREAHRYTATILAHAGSGITMTSHGAADDIHVCFDAAVDKIEKQLRRYKRRLVDRHKNDAAPAAAARHYTLAPGDEAQEEAEDQEPVIVAEQPAQIGTFSVGEAVMRLNLADAPVLMFHNARHGRINVVYRRRDGHIGWIDPEPIS